MPPLWVRCVGRCRLAAHGRSRAEHAATLGNHLRQRVNQGDLVLVIENQKLAASLCVNRTSPCPGSPATPQNSRQPSARRWKRLLIWSGRMSVIPR